MSERWHYQLNGFELGPVPASEVRRLLQKGRLAPDTPVRPEGSEVWATADRIEGEAAGAVRPPAVGMATALTIPSPAPESWPIAILERGAFWGIPLAVGVMLSWERPFWCLGALLLAGFGGIFLRVVGQAARDLDAIRRRIDERSNS